MSDSSIPEGEEEQVKHQQNGLHPVPNESNGAKVDGKEEVLDLSDIPKSPCKVNDENAKSQNNYILPTNDQNLRQDGQENPSGRPSTSGPGPVITADRVNEYDEPVECVFCRYRLEEGVHPRVVSCRECGWAATEPTRMRRHVRARHPGVKPCYYCQYCEHRVEGMESQLAAAFNDDRPYQCGECDYRARTTTALNYHLRAKHSSERPYKCPHCDYAGVQSSSLKSHMLTRHNSGEKNIKCPACDFKANVPSVMKKHVERKHGDQQFQINTRRGRRPGSVNQPSYLELLEGGGEPPNKLYKPTQRPIAVYDSSLERPIVNPFENAERSLSNFYKTAQRSVANFYESNFYDSAANPYRPYPPNPYEAPSVPAQMVPEHETPATRSSNPPNDVAEYLQMPSFGLFEAIYESQALCQPEEKLRNAPDRRQNSEVILIDD